MSKWTDQMCFQCASEEFEVSVESASVVPAASAQCLAMLRNINPVLQIFYERNLSGRAFNRLLSSACLRFPLFQNVRRHLGVVTLRSKWR